MKSTTENKIKLALLLFIFISILLKIYWKKGEINQNTETTEALSALPNVLTAFCARCRQNERSVPLKCDIVEIDNSNWISKPKRQLRLAPWLEHQRHLPLVSIPEFGHVRVLKSYIADIDSYPLNYTHRWRIGRRSSIFETIRNLEVPVQFGDLGKAWVSRNIKQRFELSSAWYKIISVNIEESDPSQVRQLASDIAEEWRYFAEIAAGNHVELSRQRHITYTYGFKASAAILRRYLQRYSNYVQGKRGVVIGSLHPWLEFEAHRAGAGSIFTVEYLNLSVAIPSDHPRLAYLPPNSLKDWVNNFDFAMSFSTIEHIGLGRYGDPLNPDGDLMEMAQISCLVKPGGLLFLAVPIGGDCMIFNQHRYYGPKRLSLLTECWKVVEFEDLPFSENCSSNTLNQPWIILQNLRGCSVK